jgi:hypothetical protein
VIFSPKNIEELREEVRASHVDRILSVRFATARIKELERECDKLREQVFKLLQLLVNKNLQLLQLQQGEKNEQTDR